MFNQTWRPFEVIVVDDYSDDGTLEKLNELARSYPPNWLKVLALDCNSGPGTARNVGWDNASGDFIAFLDADDLWHPFKTECQYGWMKAHPAAMLTATRKAFLSQDFPEAIDSRKKIEFRRIGAREQLIRNRFPTSSAIVRSNVGERFEVGKRHSEDFLLWTSMVLRGLPSFRTETALCVQRKSFGEWGLTGDLKAMLRGKFAAHVTLKRDGLIGSTTFFFCRSMAIAAFIRQSLRVRLRSQTQRGGHEP